MTTTTHLTTAHPTTTDPVLVLGATGKTGRRVHTRLAEAGRPVRAASRSGSVHFDWAEPATWGPALDGVAGIYVVPPDPGTDVAPFVEEAESAGVDRIVLLSARAAEHTGIDHFERVEATVTAASIPWTILRPSRFDQNFTEGAFAGGLASGTLALPVGDGEEAFIDADDVAAVAVAALTGGARHEGRVYELSGPELLTFADAIAVVAAASGRDVRFVDVDPDAWAADTVAQGVPPFVVDILGNLFAATRAGKNAYLSDGVEQALRRPPRSIADWATEAFAAS